MRDKIKINGYNYKVHHKILDDDVCGNMNMSNKQICISTDLLEDERRRTLSHEILHCLMTESGVSRLFQAKQYEEVCVESMESVFQRFLEDNTNFFKE